MIMGQTGMFTAHDQLVWKRLVSFEWSQEDGYGADDLSKLAEVVNVCHSCSTFNFTVASILDLCNNAKYLNEPEDNWV